MSFASPAFLWALLALPALVALELWATARDRDRTALLVARPLWGRVVERPAPVWRWVRLTLLVLGVAALALALARPQWGIVREKVEREGVDVVLVLDASGSMATEDVQPSRFFLARNALLSLVSRLSGDRFALVAFEGEAYPLVPLTLDADAIGLFLDTVEPGIVPAPGTSLGAGLVRGLELFVDPGRNNKVMVLVSDGEDLEGEIDAAVAKARELGVVIHTVGVGTSNGGPVPDVDDKGVRRGFKQEEDGSAPHVSRLDARALEAIARATGGVYVPLSSTDTSLWQLAAAIEGMEQKTLAREYSYRKKERFQIPLVIAISAITLALALPPPRLRRRRAEKPAQGAGRAAASRAAILALAAMLAGAGAADAQSGALVDEVLLRPQRLNAQGRERYTEGDHPKALESFDQSVARRPDDPRLRFNLADALYKNGKYQEAVAAFQALAGNDGSPLAGPARFNLGNALFQQGNYPAAIAAYRGALDLVPDDLDARRNLELALRAIEEQKKKQQQQQDKDDKKEQQQDQQQQQQKQDQQKQDQQKQDQQPRPKSEQEKEQQRFQDETGMSKERAMQLLDALQRAEKDEQKRQLAAQRAGKKKGKDW
jgi:Ca-activated chloride channel homolog